MNHAIGTSVDSAADAKAMRRSEGFRGAPTDLALGVAAGSLVLAATVWSYWPTLVVLSERWWSDPQYSHGFLVPVFAAVVLFLKRPKTLEWKPNPLGLLIVAAALAPRWFSARMDLAHLDGLCFVGTLLGLSLLVGGWDAFRWMAAPILFLAFMVPMPDAVGEAIAIPLRRAATVASTYVLQTFGYPAIAEGNTIQIEEIRLGVIEACSGLGMLMTFLALATAMALVVRDPLTDRVILAASAIPIAVFANILRITITAMAYASFDGERHREAIHDTLGFLMMPLALALLWLEIRFLRVLLVASNDEAPLNVPLSPWLERAGASPFVGSRKGN